MIFNFTKIKVLVIGDFMVDSYIFGDSTRMSPEAPVPVILPKKKYLVPGGAGNVAINLSSLGANVTCAGVVGNDNKGDELINILKSKNINTQHIEIIENYSTTIKERIFCNGTQLARIDTESTLKQKCSFMSYEFDNYDIIILSDYNKGVLSIPWFSNNKDIPVIIDPKKETINFKNCNIITPNIKELEHLSNNSLSTDDDILYACKELIEKHNFEYIIAKKGENGISVIGKNNFFHKIEGHHVNNPDVTGAGDTVISSLALAYASTKDIKVSAEFANSAAAIVVGKKGTATVTIDEINNYISSYG
jgi:rfaE bifunctional protein kinase chain/domain